MRRPKRYVTIDTRNAIFFFENHIKTNAYTVEYLIVHFGGHWLLTSCLIIYSKK